jgi:predicted O-methyltransferase YrrM
MEETTQGVSIMNIVEQHSLMPTDINQHLTTLYMLAVEFNAKNMLELGVRGGESTIALLQAAKEIGGSLTSIDIAPCPTAKERVREYGFESYWIFILGDDCTLDWNRPINLLFIDTTHEYEHTLKELTKYEPSVVPKGIIILHDTMRPDLTVTDCGKAVETYVEGRTDLKAYGYINNNGLTVLFKRA